MDPTQIGEALLKLKRDNPHRKLSELADLYFSANTEPVEIKPYVYITGNGNGNLSELR